MNNFEKIIELVQKGNLSAEEQEILNSLLESDPEAQKLFNAYEKVGKALQPAHISYNKLRDYVLIKNGLEPEVTLDHTGTCELENHLTECAVCSKEFKILNEEFLDVQSFVSSSMNGALLSESELIQKAFTKQKFSPWRYPLYATFILGFIYLSLYLVSEFTTPKSYLLASLGDDTEFYVTRGRGTDEFQQSLEAIEDKNFEDAIVFLKKDIEKNPDDETIFYTYYIMGLSQLGSAEGRFAGLNLFLMFDKTKTRHALENFKICIEKNNSGKFPDITNNAYFYSAKAFLMLGNIESAKKYLRLVIDNKGSKMPVAHNMLNELE
jgi:tetratricopeptide (TPR) repeat protein